MERGRGGVLPWKIRMQTQTTRNLVVYVTKVRNCRNYNWNHLFCLRFIFTIFNTGNFQVPPEKNYPQLKCQFPTLIWPKSPKSPHPPWPKEGSGGCKLCLPRPSDLDFLWLVSEKMCVVLMFLLASLLNALINWNWLEHPLYLIMWVISSPSDL